MVLKIGILALQGGVAEHAAAVRAAAKAAKITITPVSVRTAAELEGLDALFLPGGESTTMSKLLHENGMIEKIRGIRGIFGTCAGLILMAKEVEGSEDGQKFLHVLDVKVSRNAYGAQADSFEAKLETAEFGKIRAIFIRAPKIISTAPGVDALASIDGNPIVVVQKTGTQILLGCAFHPELTTTKVHEYFLRQLALAQVK